MRCYLTLLRKSLILPRINHITPEKQVNHDRMKEAISLYSFEANKKRQKVDSGFFRKGGGKSGDWRNHFNYESAMVYKEYAGDLLLTLNYEKNEDWVEDFKEG